MEKLELYEGRPADCTGRLEKEVRTYDLLDRLGIQFWRTDHAWMHADTMEACKDIDAVLGRWSVRTCSSATGRRRTSTC